MINIGNIEIEGLWVGSIKANSGFIGNVKAWGEEEPTPTGDWLCFTAGRIYSTVKLNKNGTPDPISLEYSYDKNTWTDYAWSGNTGDVIRLDNVNDKVYFRAKTENQTISKDSSNYYQFIMSGQIVASGNIQTLLKADGTRTDAPTFCYYYMFENCSALFFSPDLPATTLGNNCYDEMFSGCKYLTSAPSLPATTLANYCYYYMFENCKQLLTAPVLSATTLSDGCCMGMFYGCTSLATAPVLPATTLAKQCYNGMFSGCTSLTTAPELPATTLAVECYREMFNGCTSLTTAPELPATDLSYACYNDMFSQCSMLNEIKIGYTGDFSDEFSNWVSGVAASGTFYYNGSDTTTGTNAIPTGWTVTPF